MFGLLPLFDPPRHDTGDTVRRALELGVSVKMITGDQLAIAKETGRRLGMGTNMYPSSSLFSKKGELSEDIGIAGMDQHDLIEQADGFAGDTLVKAKISLELLMYRALDIDPLLKKECEHIVESTGLLLGVGRRESTCVCSFSIL